MGGDEFTLLLLHVETEAVVAVVAGRILRALQKPFELEEGSATTSASIGVAFFPAHATDPAALLKLADEAMYQAKQGGKNQWVLYQSGLRESVAALQSTVG